MFWRFAMLRFTTLLAHDHQKQDSCLGRKSLNVTNVPLCTAVDGIFFVNLFIRLNFVLLERCFFFSKSSTFVKIIIIIHSRRKTLYVMNICVRIQLPKLH